MVFFYNMVPVVFIYFHKYTFFFFGLSLRHEVLSSVVQHKACTTSYIILLFSKQLIPVAHCIFRAVRFLNCDQTCDWMVLSHVRSGCHGKIWLITQSLVCCGGIKSVPKRDKILLFDPVWVQPVSRMRVCVCLLTCIVTRTTSLRRHELIFLYLFIKMG